MAESPSRDSTPVNSVPIMTDPVQQQQQQQQQQYWCYHCEKHVSVETVTNLPDIICFECKNGFVESIAVTSNHLSRSTPPTIGSPSDFVEEPSFGSQFLQVLRLIAQASREEDADADAPPPPPPDAANLQGDDFLRIELDGWDNVEDGEVEFGDAVEVENEQEHEVEDGDQDDDEDEEEDRSDEDNEQNLNNNNEETDEDEDEDEEDRRRRRRDVVRLRIRDIAARARTGRNRFLDWADLLMGLEDNSIELRLQMPQHDGYVGNPEDYVDAAGYEALLQNLADSDQNGRRGPPPAAKSAISALSDWTISSKDESMQCAICKDVANVGDMVKKLPCGHGYHGDCIIPWLGSRNSCPVCRFELPTDDHEYELEKQKKVVVANNASEASGSG